MDNDNDHRIYPYQYLFLSGCGLHRHIQKVVNGMDIVNDVPTVVILLCAGGACYIAGAIVYALRKPDPLPKVFGFHEIFHTGTVAGYACHMVAIYMVIVQLWP